jgi:arylmalonate decarboxylase
LSLTIAADPVLGLIFPVERPVPEEGLAMYPDGVRFITSNLDLKTLTPDGYDAVLGDIPAAARKLRADGARAITLMGTSLSFYKGAEFNQKLTETIGQASGLPTTTMSTAVIEGLRSMKVKRPAVATAYNDEVNSRLRGFLEASDFEVVAMKGLGIVQIAGVNDVEQKDLLRFCISVFRTAPQADGMLVSCGGLRTLEILAELETQTGVPVVSSTPHALRAGVRLLGLSGRAAGYGRLLSQG